MAQPDKNMEQAKELSDRLKAFGLEGCEEKLCKLGVCKLEDLQFLREDDLQDKAGFTLVQVRRLEAACGVHFHRSVHPPPLGHGQGQGQSPSHQAALDGAAARAAAYRKSSMASQEDVAWASGSEGSGGQPANDERGRRRDSRTGHRQSEDASMMTVTVSECRRYLKIPRESMRQMPDAEAKSRFWLEQKLGRPRRVIFIRHGQSEGNEDRTITRIVPDPVLHLTALGRLQALDAGCRLKELIGDESVKFVVSPYVRTLETLNGILQAWPGKRMNVREDVRIREQEHGNYDAPNMASLHEKAKDFGLFYFRFPDGESPADCYDRASSFLESQYRSWVHNQHQNQVVVCHGLMILVTVMRLMQIPVEEFENLDGLGNGEFVVLERDPDVARFHFAFTWAYGKDKEHGGLRRVERSNLPQIWDGTPEAPLLKSQPKRRRDSIGLEDVHAVMSLTSQDEKKRE